MPVADAPETSESIAKREPEIPARDPIVSRTTSSILLVSALLMIGTLAWALWDESYGQRPWKGIQQQFVKRYTSYLKSIRKDAGKDEAQVKEDPEYQKLDAEAQAALEESNSPPDYSNIGPEKKMNGSWCCDLFEGTD